MSGNKNQQMHIVKSVEMGKWDRLLRVGGLFGAMIRNENNLRRSRTDTNWAMYWNEITKQNKI